LGGNDISVITDQGEVGIELTREQDPMDFAAIANIGQVVVFRKERRNKGQRAVTSDKADSIAMQAKWP